MAKQNHLSDREHRGKKRKTTSVVMREEASIESEIPDNGPEWIYDVAD